MLIIFLPACNFLIIICLKNIKIIWLFAGWWLTAESIRLFLWYAEHPVGAWEIITDERGKDVPVDGWWAHSQLWVRWTGPCIPWRLFSCLPMHLRWSKRNQRDPGLGTHALITIWEFLLKDLQLAQLVSSVFGVAIEQWFKREILFRIYLLVIVKIILQWVKYTISWKKKERKPIKEKATQISAIMGWEKKRQI